MIILRLIKESVLFALQALAVNKLRTFLSLLGITIGILAIISVFTVVDTLERKINESVASLGDNVIFVQKWPWTFGPDYPWWKYMNRPVPDTYELNVIKQNCKSAEAASFIYHTKKTIKYQSSSIENVQLIGISQDYDQVKNFDFAAGRYFSEAEFVVGKNIAIIGDEIARVFFPYQNAIGKTIKVSGKNVMVVGVFAHEGESIFGDNIDIQMVMPVNFVKTISDIQEGDPYIAVKGKAGITNQQLIDELTGIMRSARKLKPLAEENFALNETSLLSSQVDSMFEVIGLAGWIIGGFSILVGGFGIANIMFVSVTERTAIIGIQKSLGAKNYFILIQFLVESITLCLIGGAAGLLIIYILTLAIGDSFGMAFYLSRANVILGLTISILIGVISGFIPAYGAAQLDPVEAIRSKG